jgi:hypothetical protein
MNNQVMFSCSTLTRGGKKNILRPDDDGYYDMVLGGLNVFNSAGEYYTYEKSRQLFESSSALMRRISTGCLKGELGHPNMLPGQTYESYANRVMTIDEKNVATHIYSIWLDFNNVKDINNKPIVAIMGKVKPSGPHMQPMQASIDNPKEEVCYSIRAFSEDTKVNGVTQRALVEVVTFDWVTEPGINIARKSYSPSVESLNTVIFSKEQLIKAMTTERNNGMVLESVRNTGVSLFKSLGWDFDKKDIPKWLGSWD